MINYRWTCHICGTVNEPDMASCEKCKFPAEATGEQIEYMKTDGKQKEEKTIRMLSCLAFIVAGTGILIMKYGRLASNDALIGLALALVGMALIIYLEKKEK